MDYRTFFQKRRRIYSKILFIKTHLPRYRYKNITVLRTRIIVVTVCGERVTLYGLRAFVLLLYRSFTTNHDTNIFFYDLTNFSMMFLGFIYVHRDRISMISRTKLKVRFEVSVE